MAWLVLQWAILPRIESWRPDIERAATRSLGVPVRIGHIRVESHGWVPALELTDVVVRDAGGRDALRLAKVNATLSMRSLLHWRPRFEQLVIDRPTLEVRRDAEGRLFVAGLQMRSQPGGPRDTQGADWFFSQHQFAIRGGTLRWIDEQRRAPPLQLADVELVIHNGSQLGSRRHHWRLDATPPADWGARFTVRGRFTHPLLAPAGDIERWSGTAYADLPRADVQRLRQYLDLPFELREGAGALRVWADITEGQLAAATADLALQSVHVRLAREVQPLVLQQLTGRLAGRRDAEAYSLSASALAFRTGDGDAWPASDWSLRWRQPVGQPAAGGQLQAAQLDLAILARLAGSLPLGQRLRNDLVALQPQGRVQGLQLHWDGPPDAPTGYRVQGRVQGLSLAAERPDPARPGHVGRPGLARADLDVVASDRGGEAHLRMQQGLLAFPGVFEQAEVPLDRLSARLQWRLERDTPGGLPHVELRVQDTEFANADAAGSLSAVWRTGRPADDSPPAARLPGVLDLQGHLVRADATRTWRYLPAALPPQVRDYVRRAVVAGSSSQVDFVVKGDLEHFPFRDPGRGEFRIASQIDNATFAYAPADSGAPADWPAFTEVRGQLVFDRTSMQIRDARARLFGFQLAQVQGGIADLDQGSVLVLDGQGRGPLADALRFVNETPVAAWTSHALQHARGTGEAQLKLGIRLPLDDMERARVNGLITLAGNDVQITPDTPLMSHARGNVEFSDRGFAIRAATARVLGGEASFQGGTQQDGSLHFSGHGVASAEGLRQAGELAMLPAFGRHASGQAAYGMELKVVKGHAELDIQSNLAGLGLELPAPFDKPAAASWPLRLRTVLDPTSLDGAAVPRDRLSIDLGEVLHARYERELRDEGARVVAGGIGINQPAPEPAAGVTAQVQQGRIDLDAWQAAARSLAGGQGPAGATAAGAEPGTGDADGMALPGYAPSRVMLKADVLNIDQRRLSHVVAGLSQDDGVWRVNVDADQLNGYLEYRLPGSPRTEAGGRVVARLSRLSLPESAAQDVESLLDETPAALPALDVVVNEFELRGMKLGKLEIDAVNRRTGEIREWRLEKFSIANADARLDASGSWQGVPGSAARWRSAMDFRLDLTDSGALLARLGLGQVVRGGKGRLQGQVGWLGSPLSLDYPSLDGQFNVEVSKGQFLKVEPGIAKLAGILSLQSLPRRLTLDFRDVFQEGFAFDAFTGDVRIEQGVAQTNNLRLRGVTAAVLMEGRADVARETQDLRVVVVPEINAGTASLAYAAINPAVGLGTFLAQMFLRKPLMQAGTREFHVTGAWADPKVEPVQRKPGQPLPEGAATGPLFGLAPGQATTAAPARPQNEAALPQPAAP
ncbi:YhdP family protein [Eleftheria terrae]|uniref:YhdP family protein n=1 Tax=Eleftheria terrae TaxID=1597781 RepID=UPI00263B8835|nr:YhdP family protein [Eleftheria terrae]WKB50932.1 YhdP family protein [Eleftheria terrae]